MQQKCTKNLLGTADLPCPCLSIPVRVSLQRDLPGCAQPRGHPGATGQGTRAECGDRMRGMR